MLSGCLVIPVSVAAKTTLQFALRNFVGNEALRVIAELDEEADERLRRLAIDVTLKALGCMTESEREELDVLPSWLIDGVLNSPKWPNKPMCRLLHVMTSAAPADARVATWQEARQLCRRLRSRPNRSQSLWKDIHAVAEAPSWTEAVIQVAESGDELPLPFAAVLVINGSERAVAALRRNLRADSWEIESALSKAAKGTPAHGLIEELAVLRAEAFASSPGGVLLRSQGLVAPRVHLVATFECYPRDANLLVHIESDRNHPLGVFDVRCREGAASTAFSKNTLHHDELELGSCDVLELPQWIARAADKLNLEWTLTEAFVNPPGRVRTALRRWLVSA
jgi:hypothetical protein